MDKRFFIKSVFLWCWLSASISPFAQPAPVLQISPSDINKLMWDRAQLHGFPPLSKMKREANPPWATEDWRWHLSPWGTEEWTNTDEFLTWTVQSSEAGDYIVSILYLCKPGCDGSQYQIASGESKVTGLVHETGSRWLTPGWNRETASGTLKLSPGTNLVTMRISRGAAVTNEIANTVFRRDDLRGLFSTPKAAQNNNLMEVRALELVQPSVKKTMEVRANAERPDGTWFANVKYGLKFHWTTATQPRHGAAKSFPDAVRDFDVKQFGDMVEEAGAGYVMFTATHSVFWFAGPCPALEKLIPGRTCGRDLIGDLADELGKRRIPFAIQLEWPDGQRLKDERYSLATHADDLDKSVWAQHYCDIVSDIGNRYGKRLAILYNDGNFESVLYPYRLPWEKMTAASRAGNPNRLVCYNQWIFPSLTDFQDFWSGETADGLPDPPEARVFRAGGEQAGLIPQMNHYLDDKWGHYKPETAIAPPLHSTRDLIYHTRLLNANGAVATYDIGIYQDGTVSPETLGQLKELRKAIRGE
jgi:hypothetical protein